MLVEHLQAAVKASGFTQIEIAQRLSMQQSYVSRVLNGRQSVTWVEVRRICMAAGIPFLKWTAELDALLQAASSQQKAAEARVEDQA